MKVKNKSQNIIYLPMSGFEGKGKKILRACFSPISADSGGSVCFVSSFGVLFQSKKNFFALLYVQLS